MATKSEAMAAVPLVWFRTTTPALASLQSAQRSQRARLSVATAFMSQATTSNATTATKKGAQTVLFRTTGSARVKWVPLRCAPPKWWFPIVETESMSPRRTRSAMTATFSTETAAAVSAKSSSGGSALTTGSALTLRTRNCRAVGTGRWRECTAKAAMTAMSLTETDAAVLARWRAAGTAEATVYSTAGASAPEKGTAARVIAGTEWLTEMSSATTGFLCETETAAASTAGSSRAGTAAPQPTTKSPRAGEYDDEKILVL